VRTFLSPEGISLAYHVVGEGEPLLVLPGGPMGNGNPTQDDKRVIAPFFYGRWDAVAQAHAAAETVQAHRVAARRFNDAAAFDPPATKAALGGLTAPVLVLASELDTGPLPRIAAEAAVFFPKSETVVLPGGGHYPWLDDAAFFVRTVTTFLA
jgi:pimeloyl-ACP methyl ester carboxylesterase